MSNSIKHEQFLDIAAIIAKSSKCISMHVGAVIVKDNRIISTGFNGSPAGCTNCCDIFFERGPLHTTWSIDHEIHAELNAILYAAKSTFGINGSTLYSTHEPCKNCLKHILGTGTDGIKSVIFEEVYYNESVEDKKIKRDQINERKFPIFVYDRGHGLLVPWESAVRFRE